jgi:hypothetical protein
MSELFESTITSYLAQGITPFIPNGPDFTAVSALARPISILGGILLAVVAIVALVNLLIALVQLVMSNNPDSTAMAMSKLKTSGGILIVAGFLAVFLLNLLFGIIGKIVS